LFGNDPHTRLTPSRDASRVHVEIGAGPAYNMSFRYRIAIAIGATSLVSTTVAYGFLEVSSRAVQAAAIFMLANWYDKREFGLFYVYMAVYQLTTVLSTGGLLESFMNRLSRRAETQLDREQLAAQYGKQYFRRALPVAVIFFALVQLYCRVAGYQIDNVPFTAALVAGVCNGFVTLVAGYLTCSGANRKSIYLRATYNSLAYALAVSVAITSGDILVFFWGLCGAGLLITAFVVWNARGITVSSSSATPSGFLSDEFSWFLVPAILNWFFWYGLAVCVSKYFSPIKGAELAFANNVAAVLLIINTAVSQAWIARYLQHVAHARDSAKSRNTFVFRVQSALMLIATIVTILGYEVLKAHNVPLVMKYGELGLEISILLFSISISSPYFSAVNAFAVNSAGRRLASISLLAYLAAIASLIAACLTLGMLGVYIGLAVLIISRGYAVTFYAMRKLGEGFFDLRLLVANLALFLTCVIYYAR
jgi:O-antigen/teichoic acid export membrane protein